MLIEYGVWVSRLLVGVVFGLSAWGKAVDRVGTRTAVTDFGVPIRWAPAVATALPIVEATVAVAVLPPWTAVAASVTALLLLVVFTGAVARLLRAGEHPSCSCFGALSPTPIGRMTLVRNGVLLALVLLVLVGSIARPGVPAGLPAQDVVGLAILAVLAAVLTWLVGAVAGLRRRLDQQALSTLGAEGLPVGAVAPEFELLDPAGERTSLESLLVRRAHILLVFVHPGCEMCAALARELPRWQARARDALSIVVLGNGDAAEQAAWGVEQGLGEIPALVQQGNEVALRYRVRGTPSGVLIDGEGRVAAPVARGAIAVRELISSVKPSRRSRIVEHSGSRARTLG